MHHSSDPDLEALVVSLYLDESATDASTPTAVVGGLLINSSHFVGLDEKWRAMLDEFELWPGLHMKDFGLHNRFAAMPQQRRSQIFERAVEIIKAHNIATIAVTLDHGQYKAILAPTLKHQMSPYSLCFLGCVVGNHQIAEKQGYDKTVPFVIDSGNPYAEHVRKAHRVLRDLQSKGHFLNLGSLTFDKDDDVTALQAADVICWAVRRRAAGCPFAIGFEPLEAILDEHGHNQSPFPEVAMRQLLADLEALTPENQEEP